jgi:hypothetical protein
MHSEICLSAGNALIDLILLPAATLHLLFPWRIPAAFSTGFNREAILISAVQGFIDLPFALMAIICSISLLQTWGMVSDVRAQFFIFDAKLSAHLNLCAASAFSRRI